MIYRLVKGGCSKVDVADGRAIYRSSLLTDADIPHAFGARLPSEPPQGGRPTAAERLAAAVAPHRSAIVCRIHQVHGANIHIADGPPSDVHTNPPQADGIATATSGLAPTIVTADCLPILLAHPHGPSPCVAAVHAGWRGLVGGVIENGVRVLGERFAAAPDAILAAIGPSICPDHYEVGGEVAHRFHDADLAKAVMRRDPRPHLDLRAAATILLRRCGLREDHIEVLDLCTFCRPDQFHSYRRDGAASGRQICLIVA